MNIELEKFMIEFRKQLEVDHWGDIEPDWFMPESVPSCHESLKEAFERTFETFNIKTC